MQLDTLTEQDESISEQLNSINVSGTKLEKNIIVVPIGNTLLYVEPVYQVALNETQVPLLKKVIVASGNKVAIRRQFTRSPVKPFGSRSFKYSG